MLQRLTLNQTGQWRGSVDLDVMSGMSYFSDRLILLSTSVALVSTIVFLDALPNKKTECFFEVTITSQTAGITQLFCDKGSGFNENDSVRLELATGRHQYRFPLPLGVLRDLRLDPIDRPSVVTVSGVRIVDQDGKIRWQLAMDQRYAAGDVTRVTPRGDSLEMETGVDPMLELPLQHPLPSARTAGFIHQGIRFISVYALVFGAFLLVNAPSFKQLAARTLRAAGIDLNRRERDRDG